MFHAGSAFPEILIPGEYFIYAVIYMCEYFISQQSKHVST